MSKSTKTTKLAKPKKEAMRGDLWVIRTAPENLLQSALKSIVHFSSFGGAYAFARVNKLWGALIEHHDGGVIVEAIQVREPDFAGPMCETEKGVTVCPKCHTIVCGDIGKEQSCTFCETKVLIPVPEEDPEADETENKEE